MSTTDTYIHGSALVEFQLSRLWDQLTSIHVKQGIYVSGGLMNNLT